MSLQPGSVDRVTADRQRFHQSELFETELARNVQLSGRHKEARPQAAVAVDAQRLVLLTAIGQSATAGVALLAVDIRLDRTVVAGADVGDAVADLKHLDAQLMARDARVAEERHLAQIATNISPADADLVDAHQGLARGRLRRLGDVDSIPSPR